MGRKITPLGLQAMEWMDAFFTRHAERLPNRDIFNLLISRKGKFGNCIVQPMTNHIFPISITAGSRNSSNGISLG